MRHKKQFQKVQRKRRAQVFILASLLLVVYAVSIIAILSEMSVLSSKDQSEGNINQALNDLISEIDKYNIITMARITQNISTRQEAVTGISNFYSNYSSYFLDKGIFATITNLGINISTDVRNNNTGIINNPEIMPYIELSLQISLTSGLSNEKVLFTTTIFTGFRATYDLPSSLWHLRRINASLTDIRPLMGAEFYNTSVLINPSLSYNGFYEIPLFNQTQIRLHNGIFLYN
ncbi:MAG: hypothetical protein HeimC3_02340 [Candidatus Heimdallarchaeota archaeon LC_3]|nr:MAG: hypothetical protein HeimC3_02340 [Candidatus Heimdallarchaeota archaeon LC_3]